MNVFGSQNPFANLNKPGLVTFQASVFGYRFGVNRPHPPENGGPASVSENGISEAGLVFHTSWAAISAIASRKPSWGVLTSCLHLAYILIVVQQNHKTVMATFSNVYE